MFDFPIFNICLPAGSRGGILCCHRYIMTYDIRRSRISLPQTGVFTGRSARPGSSMLLICLRAPLASSSPPPCCLLSPLACDKLFYYLLLGFMPTNNEGSLSCFFRVDFFFFCFFLFYFFLSKRMDGRTTGTRYRRRSVLRILCKNSRRV